MVYISIISYSIQQEHALVENADNASVKLHPLNDAKVVLNGTRIKEEKELHHNDRYN